MCCSNCIDQELSRWRRGGRDAAEEKVGGKAQGDEIGMWLEHRRPRMGNKDPGISKSRCRPNSRACSACIKL